jgi:hypothetical protein
MKIPLVGAVVATVLALSGCTIAIPAPSPVHGAIAPGPVSHVYATPAALRTVTTFVFGPDSLILRSQTGVVESLPFTESKAHAIAVLKTVLGKPLSTLVATSLPSSYGLSWNGFFASYSDAKSSPGQRQWLAAANAPTTGKIQLVTNAGASVGSSIASVQRSPGVLVKHESELVLLAIPNADRSGFLVFNPDAKHPGKIGQIRSMGQF